MDEKAELARLFKAVTTYGRQAENWDDEKVARFKERLAKCGDLVETDQPGDRFFTYNDEDEDEAILIWMHVINGTTELIAVNARDFDVIQIEAEV